MLFFEVVFSNVLGLIFYCFSKAVNLKDVALVQANHWFLQNRRFRKRRKNVTIWGPFLDAKTKKILLKNASKNTSAFEIKF